MPSLEDCLVDTGDTTMTGGRLARVREHLNEILCFTYGDGVADLNINELINEHQIFKTCHSHCCSTPGRYGALEFIDNKVRSFHEKPEGDNAWINGGFFVLDPAVIDLIEGDHVMWEREPLQALASQGELNAYRHSGFWQPMDTLRDRRMLEELWASGKAPWKMW